MKAIGVPQLFSVALIGIAALFANPLRAADPLPSWNDTNSKKSIIAFVERVTNKNSPDFVPPAQRIAVFDNDGTLWSEQPMYFQLFYLTDRVQALAPEHPEWKQREPFASVLKGDMKGVAASGKAGLMRLVAATHAGMTIDQFHDSVAEWIETARHPVTGKRFVDMVYQPMLELLAYLRAHGFKTYIVSGGGIEFMRPWSAKTYGIPPEQVVGSSLKVKYELRDGEPVIVKLPEIDLVDDKEGKPVGIQRHIGRRPIFAAGNSDGDYEMLRWTTAGEGPRFGIILHHTDAKREFAYDRESHFGRLDKALDEAPQRGWVVIDMKSDWGRIYPDETPKSTNN